MELQCSLMGDIDNLVRVLESMDRLPNGGLTDSAGANVEHAVFAHVFPSFYHCLLCSILTSWRTNEDRLRTSIEERSESKLAICDVAAAGVLAASTMLSAC